jgi:hypothetical protein
LKVRARKIGVSFDRLDSKQQHVVVDESVVVKSEPKRVFLKGLDKMGE